MLEPIKSWPAAADPEIDVELFVLRVALFTPSLFKFHCPRFPHHLHCVCLLAGLWPILSNRVWTEPAGFVCLIADLALLPGQSFRFPAVSSAPVTIIVQVTFETAGNIKTVCIASVCHCLGRGQAAHAGAAQIAEL